MIRETPLELFRKACGLAGPLALSCRTMHAPDGPPERVEFAGPFLFIGRHPNDDLLLDHPEVSRRHAYLQAVGGRLACIDLKSRTKTFWDDQPEPRAWGWLELEHCVRVGPFRIERTDQHPNASPLPGLSDPFLEPEGGDFATLPFPRPIFELPIRVGGIAPTWEMRGLLAAVGRAEDCQLTLADDSVSRTHAGLVRTPLGTWLVDLGAREGVHVNGTRVRWAWLADGDTVRFGLFTMIVRYDRQPEGIGREDVPLEAGATPADSEPHGSLQPADANGRELAVRSQPAAPAVRKGSVQPPVFVSASTPAVNSGEWEQAPGPGYYAMWQQQMQLMETFHNDMAMMVQMFVAMHREFQVSVREELARVQQLTKELSRLNARLGQLPDPAAGAGRAPDAARPEKTARPAAREGRPETGAVRDSRPTSRAGAPAERPPRERKEVPGRPGPSSPSVSDERGPAASAPVPPRESSAMYADITRRITQIQRERRGYWQRILKAISG